MLYLLCDPLMFFCLIRMKGLKIEVVVCRTLRQICSFGLFKQKLAWIDFDEGFMLKHISQFFSPLLVNKMIKYDQV